MPRQLHLLSILLYFVCTSFLYSHEYHIVVVIPSYKNANYYFKNLMSVISQHYSNYHVIYVDDCSPDKTADLVEAFIKEYNVQDKIHLVRNPIRCLAGRNIQYAIHNFCKDSDIVAILDGDDCLAHENVLARVNKAYQDGNIWITMGSKKNEKEAIFRRVKWGPFYALRTYYAWLYKEIRLQDLLYQGAFFPMAQDAAKTLPMIEMAGHLHYKYIPEILYLYNMGTPINNHTLYYGRQSAFVKLIGGRMPYAPLPKPTRPSEELEKPFSCTTILIGVDSSKVPKLCQQISQWCPHINNFVAVSNLQKASKYNGQGQHVEDLEYKYSNSLSMQFLQKQLSYDFCLVCDKHFLDTCSAIDMQQCVKLLRRTKSLCMSFVALQQQDKLQTLQNTSYLQDNIFTFQFGWKPRIKYPFTSQAHLFALKEMKIAMKNDFPLVADDLQLLYSQKYSALREKAGLLYVL